MTDDALSTSASSIISDSLRDQILGKPTRRKITPAVRTPLRKQPDSEFHTPFEEVFFEHAPKEGISASLVGHTSDLSMNSYVLVSHTDVTEQNDAPSAQSRTRPPHDSFTLLERKEKTSHNSVNDVPSAQSRNTPAREQFNLLERKEKTSHHSVKIVDAKESRAPTQTVAVQTGEDFEACFCKSSECPGRADKEANVPEDSTETYTATSCQTLEPFGCGCKHCCESATSDTSDDSYSTDFLDLPYQNDEKYLKLLRELEKKLVARNKERVRKTMLEFEKRSRLNQNLERPVFDDDASLLRRLGAGPRGVCCRCGRRKRVNAVNSDILQNEKSWDAVDCVESLVKTSDPSVNQSARIERSMRKSHWRLDPRSGEWVKVSCFQQTDFAAPSHGDHLKDERRFVAKPCANGCQCRQRKRR